MHVSDYKKQLSEAIRVLEPKSPAAFSIWGRPEQCMMILTIYEVLVKHGCIKDHDITKTPFLLSLDL